MTDPRFSEAHKDFNPAALSPEARQVYEASRKAQQLYDEAASSKPALAELDATETTEAVRAGYKIEIMFGPRRTPHGPNILLLQAFESGKHFHGGGDELMYWCQDVEERVGCWGAISGAYIAGRTAYCPHCQRMINAERLTGQRFMRITTKKLATHVETIWRQLRCNADLYCKYNSDDVRYRACLDDLGPERGHRLRGLFIYPLKNILKDTSTGTSIHKRFQAFLSA